MLNPFRSLIKVFHPAAQTDYRVRLYENLKTVKDENGIVSFRVHDIKPSGCVIHVGGLYGFVHFRHFLWRYPAMSYWQAVGKHLLGHRFPGRIHELSINPINVVIDGAVEALTPPRLEAGYMVDAVVLDKAKAGLVVDAGYQFKWRGGSVIGFIYRHAFLNPEEFESAEPGQVLSTCYLGRNYNNWAVFGDFVTNPAVITPGIEKLVGETREVLVVKRPGSEPEYFVDGTYPAEMPVNGLLYPGQKERAQQAIDALRDHDRVLCEIVGFRKKRHLFKLKLVERIIN